MMIVLCLSQNLALGMHSVNGSAASAIQLAAVITNHGNGYIAISQIISGFREKAYCLAHVFLVIIFIRLVNL